MILRRLILLTSLIATAVSCFTLGIMHQRRKEVLDARAYDAKFQALRAEVRREIGRTHRAEAVVPAGVTRVRPEPKGSADSTPVADARQRMISEIKQELQSEMGLLPVHLLRDRRSSFV